MIKHILLAALGGIALVTMAHADTVCDEYGRCWEQRYPGYGAADGEVTGFQCHHWHYHDDHGFTQPRHHHHGD